MRPDEDRRLGWFELLTAFHLDLERIVASAEKEHPVVDGAGKRMEMTVDLAQARRSAINLMQKVPTGASGGRDKQQEVEADGSEQQTTDPSTDAQRKEHHQPDQRSVPPFPACMPLGGF
jgi:hypothetical protein